MTVGYEKSSSPPVFRYLRQPITPQRRASSQVSVCSQILLWPLTQCVNHPVSSSALWLPRLNQISKATSRLCVLGPCACVVHSQRNRRGFRHEVRLFLSFSLQGSGVDTSPHGGTELFCTLGLFSFILRIASGHGIVLENFVDKVSVVSFLSKV